MDKYLDRFKLKRGKKRWMRDKLKIILDERDGETDTKIVVKEEM
jgi:hypothetical protein